MKQAPVFSVIVVCLNPGNKLQITLDSITSQTYADYEVIIKDGLSSDGTIESWEKSNQDARIKVYKEKDSGIYDAMNQAVAKAQGRFVYFLNCGDVLRDENVLARIHSAIEDSKDNFKDKTKDKTKDNPGLTILYGDILEMLTGEQVTSNPRLDRFGLYRNVPCHQACFYERELLSRHPFMLQYRVRADYEQFLWCALEEKAHLSYTALTVACYEGGGFSESKANRRLSDKEHKEIAGKYMSRGEILQYQIILWLTLAPIRSKMAQNKKTAALYNRIKKIIYNKR